MGTNWHVARGRPADPTKSERVKRLKILRRVIGLSQERFADRSRIGSGAGPDRAGFPRTAMNRFEKGEKYSLNSRPHLRGIAAAAGSSYADAEAYMDGKLPLEDFLQRCRPIDPIELGDDERRIDWLRETAVLLELSPEATATVLDGAAARGLGSRSGMDLLKDIRAGGAQQRRSALGHRPTTIGDSSEVDALEEAARKPRKPRS